MKTIEFILSDHGFGHASRNIPIIRYILESNNNIKIIIKTGEAQGNFIKESLKEFNSRVKYYFSKMDVGLVLKEGSLDVDKEHLEAKVLDYINTWESRIKEEKAFLINNKIDLVVCDIVPWALKASKEANIKSILISNFTWVENYKDYLSEEIINKYKECYKKADKVLLYDLYINEMKTYLSNYKEVGMCCRQFSIENINKIKESTKGKKSIFISVGRSVEISKAIDVSSLDYYFIATEGIKLLGDNVKYLPIDTNNTHEYLMACDYVITKAGWGTLGEALIGHKKIGVLSRDNVKEDKNSINILKKRNLALEVSLNKFNLKEIIDSLENFIPNYSEYNYKNEYKEISNEITKELK